MAGTTIKGSCLCGNTTFKIEGSPARFYHCHCRRCRKATGTGHASNIMMQPASITWAGDPETRVLFKVPDAERFATHFCKTCGGPLPRETTTADLIVVPAGCLDTQVEVTPQARIFLGSKASWSCCGEDDLPGFQEYPTQ